MSQIRFHGFDPAEHLIEVGAEDPKGFPKTEDILAAVDRVGDRVALVLIGSVNFLGGQAFDVKAITEAAHKKGCRVGFDFAHGAGNLALELHQDGPDFAVWCHYKYLNGGPGTLGGCFVHQRHHHFRGPRFEGWWGTDKSTRMKMGPDFEAMLGVEAWQLSNPPILPMAALRASFEIFQEAGMQRLREKSRVLTSYLAWLLEKQPGCRILSPSDPECRGAQLSLEVSDPQPLLAEFRRRGVVCDFRHPNVIRVAPAPLYNGFAQVFDFAELFGVLRPF